ncbi:hypothetical protein BGI31_00135 [Snodgrassella communis]|nr:hypothetical protein BGI31_00135 [Snodgrassella communis]
MSVSIKRANNRIQAVCIKTDCLNMYTKKEDTGLVNLLQPLPSLKLSAYLTAVLRISLPEQTKFHAKITFPTTVLPYIRYS